MVVLEIDAMIIRHLHAAEGAEELVVDQVDLVQVEAAVPVGEVLEVRELRLLRDVMGIPPATWSRRWGIGP